jgi:phage-related minor tail protein
MDLTMILIPLGMGLGTLLTLSFQAHQRAKTAVTEANKALTDIRDASKRLLDEIASKESQISSRLDLSTHELSQRLHKLELRVEDATSRFQVMKR